MRTEKSRLRRSLLSLQELMRQIRHHVIGDQVGEINASYAATMPITVSPEIFGVS
jgi:hypothetical protein